jgi:hypothetical protein
VILNQTILQVLSEVRESLLSGRVMKSGDLDEIVSSKPKKELEKYPNGLIV